MRVALGADRSTGAAFLTRDTITSAALGASFDLIDRVSEEAIAEQLSVSEFNIYAEMQVRCQAHLWCLFGCSPRVALVAFGHA